ncbi:MAG: LytTR family DNA-binding domain-containing protein [Bacteroidia bacterium]|nr:LytTR family DNA-binding domain-containing protein [Bacteroidia bacterium]
MTLKAVLIDDEPDSIAVLSFLLAAHCPEVEVVAACGDGQAGLEAIRQLQPDLVFLDIEMPRMNAFQLLDHFPDLPFRLIFVTAYDQFAVKAFRYAALDYLLKPVNPEELKEAVAKAVQLPQMDPRQLEILRGQLEPGKQQPLRLLLPLRQGYSVVNPDDILYCESEGSYTRLYLANAEVCLVTRILGDVSKTLEGSHFFRTHKSWLVNLNHVQRFFKTEGAYVVMRDGRQIPLARNRRDDFLRLMTQL